LILPAAFTTTPGLLAGVGRYRARSARLPFMTLLKPIVVPAHRHQASMSRSNEPSMQSLSEGLEKHD
jgi:hypothetical protein